MFLNVHALQNVSFETDANKYQGLLCSIEAGMFSLRMKSAAWNFICY